MSTLILPFSLWQASRRERMHLAPALKDVKLTHFQQWFSHAHLQSVDWLSAACADYETDVRLNTPQEWAQAFVHGWLSSASHEVALQDGLLPWAAQAAQARGLQAPPTHGWAWWSWCHWQVGTDSVVLLPPQALALTAVQDDELFALMSPYLKEDGITIYQDHPGHWLAHATHFKNLPTASLQRMLNRNVHNWLAGGSAPQANARLVRRLQNEVQMMLYHHPLNHERTLAVNSFWLHATGDLPIDCASSDFEIWDDLIASASTLDFTTWLETWQQLDARFAALPQAPECVILCAEDGLQFYVQSKASTSWVARLKKYGKKRLGRSECDSWEQRLLLTQPE